MDNEKKKSYKIEKTVYQDQMKVIDIQEDKIIFMITFNSGVCLEEKEELMNKIHSVLNS